MELDTKLLEKVTIRAPNFQAASFHLIGTAAYCQHKFRPKAAAKMREAMVSGKNMVSNKREKRNFEEEYEEATYKTVDGLLGIPASCFRTACISACRLCGFKMTLAKLSIFIEADYYDDTDGVPLVKISGDRRMCVEPVRNANGSVDLRSRPIWDEWSADLRVRWDGDIFTTTDVLNLLMRVGLQVGIGEGRPDSKSSAGVGRGTFRIELATEEGNV